MKKVFLSIAVVLAFASIASAANVDITTVTGLSFKPSANVLVFYGKDGTGQNYVLNSKHKAGDRIYSTSNNTSTIWYKAGAAGTALAATDGNTTPGDSVYSGWSSQ